MVVHDKTKDRVTKQKCSFGGRSFGGRSLVVDIAVGFASKICFEKICVENLL
jgi:hypothetical protein